MGEIIVKNAVERKAGYLYYIDAEGNLCEAELIRKGRVKKVEPVKKRGLFRR